jgi:small subunit ribosomal protein S20
MAHSVSARKRIRQNAKARSVNRWRKVNIRAAMKDYRETILHGTAEDAKTKLSGLYKLLDQASSTSTMHKNTTSRYKSRLTAKLNQKQAESA